MKSARSLPLAPPGREDIPHETAEADTPAAAPPADSAGSLLFDAWGVGLAEAEAATRVLLSANQGLASLLGRPAHELVGLPVDELVHPADRAAARAELLRLAHGEAAQLEAEQRLLHADGSGVWVRLKGALLRDAEGRPWRLALAVLDAGARRQAEAALAASQARLRMAVQASGLGLWEWWPDDDRLQASDEVLRLLGLAHRTLRGHTLRALVHPDDVDVLWALDDAVREQRDFHAEYRVRRPDGGVRWMACHARYGRDEEGRPRLAGTLQDITVRRHAEDALRRARDELEARVRERTDALASANVALVNEVAERRAVEAQVRELLGRLVVAEEDERRRLSRDLHDSVGQHLTALSLGLTAIENDPQLPPALRPRLTRLQQAAGQLDEEIDRLSHQLRPLVLDDLGLEDALRRHAADWSEAGDLAVDVQTHGLRGRRFPRDIESTVYRFVQEALTNVRKHADAARVGVLAECHGRELRVIVEDDGAGFQVGALRHHQRGLGLRGMSERAAMAGGQLQIESTPGLGTTLYLTLPISMEDA